MSKPVRSVVALVMVDDVPHLRTALESAGFDVPVGYARDFRSSTTAFATFVETYKPDVIVLDLHPPAGDAIKDLLSFRSLPVVEGIPFVLATGDDAVRAKLPKNVHAVELDDADSLVGAVKRAVTRSAA